MYIYISIFPSSQKDTFPFTRIAIYKEVPCISKLVLCEEKIEQVCIDW